jgi:uncharacterized membrane protein YraQ (UPF0718 family)
MEPFLFFSFTDKHQRPLLVAALLGLSSPSCSFAALAWVAAAA